jgi:outer membrane protein assembly factor BamB
MWCDRRSTQIPYLIGTLALVMGSVSVPAADAWPRFRGPEGGGVGAAAPDVPANWSAQTVTWHTALPARGHSSPVLWQGLLVTTSADPMTGRRSVIGMDAATGAIRWTQEAEGPVFRQHADNSFASATPAIDGDRIYVAWLAPEKSQLIAFDHAGKPQWTVDLGSFVAQHGGGASPTVVDGTVILPFEQDGPGDSFVLAFDAATGKEKWRLPRTSGKLSCSTPAVMRSGKDTHLICTSTNHGVYAVDLATGKEVWSMPKAFTLRCVASPVVANGMVFASDGQGAKGMHLIAVRPPQKPDEQPTLAWELINGAPYVPCVVVRDELLFLVTDSGQAACLNAITGKEIWRQPLGVGTFYGSPIVVGDRLFAISRRGEVVCVSATTEFKNLGVSALGEGSFATPAVAGNRLFLRTFTGVTAVGK